MLIKNPQNLYAELSSANNGSIASPNVILTYEQLWGVLIHLVDSFYVEYLFRGENYDNIIFISVHNRLLLMYF